MIDRIRNYFKKQQEYTAEDLIRPPSTKNHWGNAINFDRGDMTRISGHRTPSVKVGHVFGQRMESGKIGIFKMKSVRNCHDPRDMFFAEVEFMHYLKDCN